MALGSLAPQTLRFDWQGVSPLTPLATGTDTTTAIQLPPGFTGPVQCQVFAYANHATGTTQETVQVPSPQAPALEGRGTVKTPAATASMLLKFKPTVGVLTARQRLLLTQLLATSRSTISITAGATGTAKTALRLAKARAAAITKQLRTLGYTGPVTVTAKGTTDQALLRAIG